MEIDISQWVPNQSTIPDKIVGKVKVLLNGKMYVWMTVLRGKSKPFCKFPSIKSNQEYIPVLGWVDNDKMERTISDEVIRKLELRNEL